MLMRCKEAILDCGTTVTKTWDFSATRRQKKNKEMRSCIPTCAFCVLFSSAVLVTGERVGNNQAGSSSAQVEFTRVSTQLSSFANLCPHTACVRKTGLKTRLDKTV